MGEFDDCKYQKGRVKLARASRERRRAQVDKVSANRVAKAKVEKGSDPGRVAERSRVAGQMVLVQLLHSPDSNLRNP